MGKIYVGVDNGVSGSIGVVGDSIDTVFTLTPTKKELNYQKEAKNITRLDYSAFMDLFSLYNKNDLVFLIERPRINPQQFNTSLCASRCHEAELIMVEVMGCKHLFIDSKEWQKEMLPKGIKGSDALKKASFDVGNRLFPQFADHKHKDRDGLLMAEYARRKNL